MSLQCDMPEQRGTLCRYCPYCALMSEHVGGESVKILRSIEATYGTHIAMIVVAVIRRLI